MNREQRRALAKSEQNKELSEKIAMFSNLPSECNACVKPFDKTDKQQVFSWNVVVRDSDTVRLYCPDCWELAMNTVREHEQSKD